MSAFATAGAENQIVIARNVEVVILLVLFLSREHVEAYRCCIGVMSVPCQSVLSFAFPGLARSSR